MEITFLTSHQWKNHKRLQLRSHCGHRPSASLGGIVGGFIMRLLGVAGQGGMIYTIIVAVIGAVILTWIVRSIKKA
jgi:hypothetical protein